MPGRSGIESLKFLWALDTGSTGSADLVGAQVEVELTALQSPKKAGATDEFPNGCVFFLVQ